MNVNARIDERVQAHARQFAAAPAPSGVADDAEFRNAYAVLREVRSGQSWSTSFHRELDEVVAFIDRCRIALTEAGAECARLLGLHTKQVHDWNAMVVHNAKRDDELTEARAEVARLREVVNIAMHTFQQYAALHAAKRTPEGDEKAAANHNLAAMFGAALASTPPAPAAAREANLSLFKDARSVLKMADRSAAWAQERDRCVARLEAEIARLSRAEGQS